jgi:DNA-binding MarR family transcriptional regulator
MATASADQLTLFDLPPDTLWRLPEARSDREYNLATLLRNILWQHQQGECHASNEWFASDPAMGLKCDVATVRRGLQTLEDCGLIRREFDNFRARTIVPLVTAEELIARGWEALARAIVGMKQWAQGVRKACRELLRGAGKRHQKADSLNSNCAASARTIARPFPYKGREAQKTTTAQQEKPASSSEHPESSVAVSASQSAEASHETLSESARLAVEAGLGTHAARTVTSDKPLGAIKGAIQAARAYAATHEVRNLPGLLSKAIREGWLPPAAPATHASDLGGAPVAKKVKVRFDDQQNVKSDKAQVGPYVQGSGYEQWKANMTSKRKGLR